jgi:hypothetical protein
MGLDLKSVTIHGFFDSTLCPPPISLPVKVTILEASGPPTCRVPDSTRVLCPEATATLTTTVVNQCVALTVPLPSGCCITGDVFVRVTVVGPGSCTFNPPQPPFFICTAAPCINCQSYRSGTGAITEWCNAAIPTRGNWRISVDADCCISTPALPQSWGGVKTLYR